MMLRVVKVEVDISMLSMTPDFIWIKNRNSIKWHLLVNGVIGYNKFMSSNSDMALSTEAHVTNVHKTGYTVNDIDSGTVNEPGLTYVAWNWKLVVIQVITILMVQVMQLLLQQD